MRRIDFRRLAALALVSCLVFGSGCLFGTDDVKVPPNNENPDFKLLTEKENVIYNLVLSYAKADSVHFDELLHSDYTWHNQDDPLNPPLEPVWTRAQELNITVNIFKAAKGLHPDPNLNLDKLELDIKIASWQPVDSVGGNPCTDCWQTVREYYLTLVTKDGMNTYIANDLVEFIVVPVDVDGTKLYKIWRAEDRRK